MATEGDPYLLPTLLAFDTHARLDAFLAALRAVIARHDILRTAVVWEGLPEPMQVVWRDATLIVEEISLDAAAGDIAEQLRQRFDPRNFRLDIRQAPMMPWIPRSRLRDRSMAVADPVASFGFGSHDVRSRGRRGSGPSSGRK